MAGDADCVKKASTETNIVDDKDNRSCSNINNNTVNDDNVNDKG